MKRRISISRLAVVLLILTGGGAVAVAGAQRMVEASTPAEAGAWYAPYVDATVTPENHFEDLSVNPSNDVVLGFIVASRQGGCVPTWGTYFDLAGAAASLDLDRRIARLRQRGGDLIVSFGGAANDELATHCSERQLLTAYSRVINRYQLKTIDLDIEGPALEDRAANQRRARVIKRLQSASKAAGHELTVWVTLPVAANGMPAPAVRLVKGMLAEGVHVAGVNVLTMDFGSIRGSSLDIVQTTSRALDASWRQLDAAYRHDGIILSAKAVWHKLGMTPMIGQNDVPGERVTIDDAAKLLALAKDRGLGRVSMWSLNRDTACGAQLDLGIVSNLCSGITQAPLAFTRLFDQLPGRAAARLTPPTVTTLFSGTRDNPASSPYPVWSDTKIYDTGAKVTWHHNVFQAKWYSEGNVPDEPVKHEWDTPWRFLGPVLPGDKLPTTPKLRVGTYPAWSARKAYVKGERVQLNGIGYDAQWWTQGDRPDHKVAQPWDTPWQPVQH